MIWCKFPEKRGMKKSALLAIMLFIATQLAFPQGKYEGSFGVTVNEGWGFKFRYGNNLQFGVSQIFYQGSPLLTGIEICGHFAGKQMYGTQKAFYLLAGAGSTIFAKGYSTFEKTVIYPRVGRTINFTGHLGLNLDLGIDLLFDKALTGSLSVFPTGSANFFFRF